ncbi:hypothetical protein Bpfe_006949, partial [Biomphalaria pfeifferi]
MSEDKGEKPRRQHRFKITSKKASLQSNPIDARARDNDSQMMQSSHLLEEGILQHKRIRSESRPKLHDYQDDANRGRSHNDGNASGETRAERFIHRRSKSSLVGFYSHHYPSRTFQRRLKQSKGKEKKPIPLNRHRRSHQALHVTNDKKARGKQTKKGGSTHSFLASPKTSRNRSRHSISKDTSKKLQEKLSPLLSEAQSYRVHAKNAKMPQKDELGIRKKVNVSPKENSREKSPPKAAPCPSKEKVCLTCPQLEEVVKAKTPTSPPRERRKSPRQSSGERRSAKKCDTVTPICNKGSILDAVLQHGFEKDLRCKFVEQRSDLSMSTAKGKKSPVSWGKEKNKGKKKESSPKAPGACIPGYRFIKRCARPPSLNRRNFFGNLAQ